MARRARQCNVSDAAYVHTLANSEQEFEWRKGQIVQLTNLHSPYNMSDIEFSIATSQNADLEVTLATNEFIWRWDVMSLPHRFASQVLSAQLIMPLLSFTALAASVDEPIRDMTVYSLTRAADSQAKTAKRSLGRQMAGCMTKPMVLTTLQRITQVIEGNMNPVSVAINEEDYPSLLPVPPLPRVSSPSSSTGKRRRSLSPPSRPHDHIPSSASRPKPSQRREHAGDTEDEDDPKPAAGSHRHQPATSSSPTRPIDTSGSSAPSSPPKPAPKVVVEECEADAEARRRAAITRIVQDPKGAAINPGISVKAAGKRRRF
ncbi:hypothetical protein FRB96_002723 [Tulasnella sp. 330]|nr:hypothetical protein FRB96_002723 [Tulasnella sp. 330]